MTYEETAALMVNGPFIDRVKVACLHYADYIVDESPGTPAHNTRYRWAQGCLAAPGVAANNVVPIVVGEPQVQTDGANISDADLQVATETAINKIL